ncbi:MAG: M20/M25/M40 family metallo-hydrolase [Actinobacteria bacterium]|nr:M20/M25/M40 family metallo-hydrolase [Actinomycetota bacterium]
MRFDDDRARALIDEVWDREIIPALCRYIRIPNVSPAFDPDWKARGHMDAAVTLVHEWCASRPVDGFELERLDLGDRTPVLFGEVPATNATDGPAVLLYGHLDKQPEMTGWRDGLGPWTPVIDGDRLYGRGGADDGYASFAALTALQAVEAVGGQHRRCLVLIEASEESGSPDLPAHVDALADRIGEVDLVVCLDSGAATYDRLWVTTSLRGLVNLRVDVRVLTEGVHSGTAGGIVPSTMDVLRQLLDRVEDPRTGEVLVPVLNAEVPDERVEQARATAAELGDGAAADLPFAGTTRPLGADPVELLLNRTWRPSLEVVAAGGIPEIGKGGNVLRPSTALLLSFRLPPAVDRDEATDALVHALVDHPPFGAEVSVDVQASEAGWAAPATAPWLATAIDRASMAAFGTPARAMGEGGTIPFMAMLGRRFPGAQFVVTGVLGPQSNAHGPNEFLHVPYAKGVTLAVAQILHEHARHR